MTHENNLVDRVLALLASPAEALLDEYFNEAGPFAAGTFDLIGDNPPASVSAHDLLAVSTLDVAFRPVALRHLLGARAQEVQVKLADLPMELNLWEADPAVLDAIDSADVHLRTFDGCGPVISSKLLARKRPQLVPILDRVVLSGLGQPCDAFMRTRRALAASLGCFPLQQRLTELSHEVPPGISRLRILDVVVWMRGSGSRNARRARSRHGL